MATKKITLYYRASADEITAPPPDSIERKDSWLKGIQSMLLRKEFRIIKVTYELFNPEIENQRKFFNGPVVEYYALQNRDILSGEIPSILKKQAREQLLDSVLGYDVVMLDRTTRRRKSTTDFEHTQQWNDFLETLRETEFDPNGYEFPNSEDFWALSKVYGYDKAKTMSIENLQKRISAKHADLSTH